jgi:branched-subunit amino acid ABC-type transport system permease component
MFLFALALFFQHRLFKFFDLSLSATFLLGGYSLVALEDKMPALLAVGLSITSSAVFAALLLIGLYKPLLRVGASSLELILASLGLYIIVFNVIPLFFDEETHRPDVAPILSDAILLGSGIIVGAQAVLIMSSLLCWAVLYLVIKYTKAGRAFRAISNSSELAQDLGLGSGPTILATAALGGALVGLAGTMITLDIGVRPSTAFPLIVPALAALLVFGGHTINRVLLGTVTVAAGGELGGLVLGQQWRELSIFAVTILILVIRTRKFGEHSL